MSCIDVETRKRLCDEEIGEIRPRMASLSEDIAKSQQSLEQLGNFLGDERGELERCHGSLVEYEEQLGNIKGKLAELNSDTEENAEKIKALQEAKHSWLVKQAEIKEKIARRSDRLDEIYKQRESLLVNVSHMIGELKKMEELLITLQHKSGILRKNILN